MGTVVKPHTFTTGGTVLASEHNANFDTLYMLVNGNIEAANIASGAVGEAELAASAVTNTKVSATAGITLSKLAAMTASRVPVSDASGFLTPSAVTSTELGYVSGVTSAIQTQLNAKVATATYTAADVLAKLITVDGAGSGVDADKLDGFQTLTTTASLTGGSIAAGASTTATISLTGATVGSPVIVGVPASWPQGLSFSASVFAVDEVDVMVQNPTSVSQTQPSGTYRVVVFKL